MGRAKALLSAPSGEPLALVQAEALLSAGLDDVIVVVGHGVDEIASRLDDSRIRIAYNPEWENGRIGSLQVGLKSAGSAFGVIVLPVDTVGVSSETFAAVLAHADQTDALAVRPFHAGKPGRVLWIGHALFDAIEGIEASPDFRLDEWIEKSVTRIDVDDPAVLNNINTIEQWKAIKAKIPFPGKQP